MPTSPEEDKKNRLKIYTNLQDLLIKINESIIGELSNDNFKGFIIPLYWGRVAEIEWGDYLDNSTPKFIFRLSANGAYQSYFDIDKLSDENLVIEAENFISKYKDFFTVNKPY